MDSIDRFSRCVDNYWRYRPSYPAALVSVLEKNHRFRTGQTIADVGAGTGKLTEVFLKANYRVVAVEPNEAMRQASETLCSKYTGFSSLAAPAENLPFDVQCLDAIVVGQALHWFDVQRSRREFLRVLQPKAPVAVMFNNRCVAKSEFLQGYETLLYKHCPEYPRIGNKHYDEKTIVEFYGGHEPAKYVLQHKQVFDGESLVGRLLSSSYVPLDGGSHRLLIDDLEKLFNKHENNGTVEFLYDCEVFCARFDMQPEECT